MPSIKGKFTIQKMVENEKIYYRIRFDSEEPDPYDPSGVVGCYFTIDPETMEIFIFPRDTVDRIIAILERLHKEQEQKRLEVILEEKKKEAENKAKGG